MTALHPQFIKDSKGNNSMVVLPVEEYEMIINELEEIEDIKLYDEAKMEDTGERILLRDYLNKRQKQNA